MDILQGVSIFLAVALIVFVMSTVWLAFQCNSNALEYYDQKEHIEQLREDNKQLLSENVRLLEENQRLIIANDELKAINTELSAPTPEPEEPELQTSESNESPLSSQSDDVLQTDATKLKERLPEGVATNRYDCEGFSFPEGTAQYKLQQLCTNDWETGTRIFTRDNIRYRCVAMGTAYGIDIGDAWEVTLHNGYTFPVVLADYQHDISFIDPNDFGERFIYDDNGDIIDNLRNYDGDPVVHVLEFIADLDAMPQAAKDAGGMHGLTIFGGKYGPGGNIVNLKYLGRVWEP